MASRSALAVFPVRRPTNRMLRATPAKSVASSATTTSFRRSSDPMIGSCTPLVARTRSGCSAMTASRLMLLGVIPPIEACRPRFGRVIVKRRPADQLATGTDGEEDFRVGRRKRHDALGKPGHGHLATRDCRQPRLARSQAVPVFCSIGAVPVGGGRLSARSRLHAGNMVAAEMNRKESARLR